MKKDVKKMLMWVTNTLLATLITGLPMIALNVENETIGLLLILIAGLLINAYGIFYLKFSKYVIGEKWFNLKVHQYKDGKVWVESNDVIDNIIDIEVVEHDYKKIDYDKRRVDTVFERESKSKSRMCSSTF